MPKTYIDVALTCVDFIHSFTCEPTWCGMMRWLWRCLGNREWHATFLVTQTVGHCRQTSSGVEYVKRVSTLRSGSTKGVLFTFVRDEDRSAIYCRASRTGDAPRVAVVAQNIARFLCCCCCCCCYPLQLFLSLVLAKNRHIGGVFPFFLESKQHHKIPMSLAPRKPKSMVFTICFLRLVIITTVFTVFFCPAPSKSTGIYAVFSMLQEVFLDTNGTEKKRKLQCLWHAHTNPPTNAQNEPSKPYLGSKPCFYPCCADSWPSKNVKHNQSEGFWGRVGGRGCSQICNAAATCRVPSISPTASPDSNGEGIAGFIDI